MPYFNTTHSQNTIQCDKIENNQQNFQHLTDEINLIIMNCIKSSKNMHDLLPFLNKKLNEFKDISNITKINFTNFFVLIQKLNEEIYVGSTYDISFIIEIFIFINTILNIKISFHIEISPCQFLLLIKLFKLILHKASLDNNLCSNISNSLLLSKSLKNISSSLKNQKIVDELIQPIAEICVYGLHENLGKKNYKTVITILSHIKYNINKNDPLIMKLLMAAFEIKQTKKIKNKNVSISSLTIVLIIQELLSANVVKSNLEYIEQISKFILEILFEFFSHAILSSNKKPDEINQMILKMTDDFIILSYRVKYPASIYLLMTFKRFATKMFETSNVSISTKTNSVLIISKIVSFFENCINSLEFEQDNLDKNNFKATNRIICVIDSLSKSKGEKLKTIFICRFGFETDQNFFHENIDKIDLASTSHSLSDKNVSKSLKILNASMLIKYKIKSAYGYFTTLLKNSSVPVRMWTLKSINYILKSSSSFFDTAKLYHAVKERMFDRSYLVRRHVVEIFGTLIKYNHSKSNKFIDILYNRSLDSSYPVRKSVMTNLGEIVCLKAISEDSNEILYKMLQRIDDRKGIRKIIVFTIKKIWLVSKDEDVLKITDSVINIIQRLGEDSQENISKIFSLIDDSIKSDDNNLFFKGIKRVLDNIFQTFLSNLSTNAEYSVISSNTLCVFAKILPIYFEDYISVISNVIQNLKIDSDITDSIFQNLCQLFSQTFPSSKNFKIEELILIQDKLVKIILQNSSSLGEAIFCLKLIIEKHPESFKLISELFYNYIKFLETGMSEYENSNICRILYTLSGIIKNFPLQELFKNETNLTLCVKRMGNLFLKLSKTSNMDQKIKAMMCLMNFLHQNPKYFLEMCYKEVIISCLQTDSDEALKICIVKSFLSLLKAEELKGQTKDENPENKYTLISSVIQTYFATLQQTYSTKTENIRRTIFLITRVSIKLGLLNPQKYILIIITMLLDPLVDIQKQAIHNLKMVKKKFPGVIESNIKLAVSSAYNAYRIIVGQNIYNESIQKNKECFFEEIYVNLINKIQRRKFIQIFLSYLCSEKQDIEFILFCSFSLAYLPFRYISDVFYTLNQIEISLGLFDDIENEEDSNIEILVVPTFKKLVFLKIKLFLLKTFNLHQEQINFESPSTSLIDANMPERKGKSSLDFGFVRKFKDSNEYHSKKFYILVCKELQRISKSY